MLDVGWVLATIVPFFKRHPLRTSKQGDFLKLSECLELADSKVHLTYEGMVQIVRIAETMNHRKQRDAIIAALEIRSGPKFPTAVSPIHPRLAKSQVTPDSRVLYPS